MSEENYYKGVLVSDAKAAVSYLAAVVVIITVEVVFQSPTIGKWPFFVVSGLVVCFIFYAHWKIPKSRILSIALAFPLIAIMLLLVLIIGVNYKFLIGGSV